jgi:hypothetical protein
MNVVDFCGWLEYFSDGPNAGFFAPAIENTAKLLVPTLTLFEVFKRFCVPTYLFSKPIRLMPSLR